MGTVGELMFTVGLILLLFVGYQLIWTNISAAQAAERAATQVQEQWVSQGTPTPTAEGPREATPAADQPEIGTPFGLVYIPRLRDEVWGQPLVQGVGPDRLRRGSVTTWGPPCPASSGTSRLLGTGPRTVSRCAASTSLRRATWWSSRRRRTGSPTNWMKPTIVSPSDVWVIDPVPGELEASPTEALITLTSCNPRWASTERYIWWGHLVDTTAKSSGTRPAALKGA